MMAYAQQHPAAASCVKSSLRDEPASKKVRKPDDGCIIVSLPRGQVATLTQQQYGGRFTFNGAPHVWADLHPSTSLVVQKRCADALLLERDVWEIGVGRSRGVCNLVLVSLGEDQKLTFSLARSTAVLTTPKGRLPVRFGFDMPEVPYKLLLGVIRGIPYFRLVSAECSTVWTPFRTDDESGRVLAFRGVSTWQLQTETNHEDVINHHRLHRHHANTLEQAM